MKHTHSLIALSLLLTAIAVPSPADDAPGAFPAPPDDPAQVAGPSEITRDDNSGPPGGTSATDPASSTQPAETDVPPARRKIPHPTRGVLPSAAAPPAPPTPREVLEDYGITAERWANLTDGSTMTNATDRELLLRLAFRLPNLAKTILPQAARPIRDLSLVVQSPGDHRGRPFGVVGRVVMIEPVPLTEEDRARFEVSQLYRCHLFAGQPELPVVLYIRQIPRALAPGEPLDQRISFQGLFLKRGVGSVGVAPLIFIAPHMAWHPDTLLGDLNMDVALLDDVQQHKPLQAGEREGFYAMLAAVDRAGSGELVRHARNEIVHQLQTWRDERTALQARRDTLKKRSPGSDSPAQINTDIRAIEAGIRDLDRRIDYVAQHVVDEFIPLLEDPAAHVGELKMFRGTAHRVLQVRVTEPDVIERYDIAYYYQIDMMVNLQRKLRLIRPDAQGRPDPNKVERDTWQHPATVCVLELPDGMPVGDKIHEDIRVAGFLLKSWGFPTEEMDEQGVKWRSAPMLIARRPLWDAPEAAGVNPYLGVIAGGLFVLALSGVWLAVWRLSRSDQQFHHVVMAKAYGSDAAVSLNDLDLDVVGQPDFRHLEVPQDKDTGSFGELSETSEV